MKAHSDRLICLVCEHEEDVPAGMAADATAACSACGEPNPMVQRSYDLDQVARLDARDSGPRTCIFCGGTPVTREHVWPQWLTRHFADEPIFHDVEPSGFRPLQRLRALDLPMDIEGGQIMFGWDEAKGTGGSNADHTVKVACGPCNSGWMSRLEVQGRPILLRHIESRSAVMTEDERDILVRWLMKTTAVFEMDDPPSAALQRDELAAIADLDGPLPDGWRVDAAWVPRHFHMAHGRAGLKVFATGDIEWHLMQTIVVGSVAYILQHRPNDRVGFRRMRLVRRAGLWPVLETKRLPKVGRRRWTKVSTGRYLFALPPA